MHLSIHTRSALNVGLWVRLFWQKWSCFKKQNADGPCGVGWGRVLRVQPYYAQAHCIHCWLALPGSHTQLGNRSNIFVDWKSPKASFHTFEEVHIKWNNIEALLGGAHFYKLNQGYVEALGELSQVLPDPYLQQNMKGELLVVSVGVCWGEFQSIFWLVILLQKWDEWSDVVLLCQV